MTIEPLSVARSRRRIVMNVSRFNTPPKTFDRRIVDRQGPVLLLTGNELFENKHKYGKHQRCGLLVNGLKQFVEAIPIIFDTRTTKPNSGSSASASQRCPG
jgi:hypothetical protein